MKLLEELEASSIAKEYDPHDLLSESDRAFQITARTIKGDRTGIVFLVYYFNGETSISMDLRGCDIDDDLVRCIISLSKEQTLKGAMNKALDYLGRITGEIYQCKNLY